MNVEELKTSGNIIFECVAGSRAYSLATPTSDTDIRGIFKLPLKERLTILNSDQEIGNDTQDIKYYELEKFFHLAIDCNPNIIELLFSSVEHIKICTRDMQEILDNRNLFISQKAFHTFGGYCFAQIKKCRGQNKLVHNPKPEEPPVKEDFCWIVPLFDKSDYGHNLGSIQWKAAEKLSSLPPFRPIPLKEVGIDLKNFHVAALEHVPNTFRLYNYSDGSKGVFRNGMLVCENIPLEDEETRFSGILIYNQHEYDKTLVEWKNYWNWVEKRNQNRWKDQENKLVDFDCKNMMHAFRLLYSGQNILEFGVPLVKFEGAQREFLLDIRAGKFSYEYLIDLAEKEMARLEDLKKHCKLPHGANVNKINELFQQIVSTNCFKRMFKKWKLML
jgi:hypothetical protein